MAFACDMMAPAPFWHNGPAPGALYNFPGNASNINVHGIDNSFQRSQTPITTTTTVLAVKFDSGVIIAADTLGSYGSLARFRNCPRILNINKHTMMGCSGDYGDFQYLKDIIEQKIIDEQCIGDSLQFKPRSIHCWLTRVLYNKRSKFDPLWNNYIVAGIQDGEPFLGAVDKLGTAYEDSAIATGLGAYMATPLIRNALEKGPLNQDAARNLVHKCMEVLFYRDARSFPRYQIGIVTKEGVVVEEPIELKHNWQLAHMIEMK